MHGMLSVLHTHMHAGHGLSVSVQCYNSVLQLLLLQSWLGRLHAVLRVIRAIHPIKEAQVCPRICQGNLPRKPRAHGP